MSAAVSSDADSTKLEYHLADERALSGPALADVIPSAVADRPQRRSWRAFSDLLVPVLACGVEPQCAVVLPHV